MIPDAYPKLPNFFVGGAPRCGTTSLHRYLAQHPAIFMSPIKEPTYFAFADLLGNPWYREKIEQDHPRLRAFLDGPQTQALSMVVTDWNDYLKLFRDVGAETAIGESSVGYFVMPSAASAIRASLPHARLIFLLRDPADRLSSSYMQALEWAPKLSFREWFAARDPGPPSWHSFDNACYATQLRRFYTLFPADQIQVHLFEDFVAEPRATLRAIFGFLGVASDYSIDTSTRHNTSMAPRFARLHQLRKKVLGDRPLTRGMPEPLANRLRQIYRRGRNDFRLSPVDRRMVIAHYREEIRETAELIGRDLSPWLR